MSPALPIHIHTSPRSNLHDIVSTPGGPEFLVQKVGVGKSFPQPGLISSMRNAPVHLVQFGASDALNAPAVVHSAALTQDSSNNLPTMNDARADKDQALSYLGEVGLFLAGGGVGYVIGRTGLKKSAEVVAEITGASTLNSAFQLLRNTAVTVKGGNLSLGDMKDFVFRRGELFKNVSTEIQSVGKQKVAGAAALKIEEKVLSDLLSILNGASQGNLPTDAKSIELYKTAIQSMNAVAESVRSGGSLTVDPRVVNQAYMDQVHARSGISAEEVGKALQSKHGDAAPINLNEQKPWIETSRRQAQAAKSKPNGSPPAVVEEYQRASGNLHFLISEYLKDRAPNAKKIQKQSEGYSLLMKVFR